MKLPAAFCGSVLLFVGIQTHEISASDYSEAIAAQNQLIEKWKAKVELTHNEKKRLSEALSNMTAAEYLDKMDLTFREASLTEPLMNFQDREAQAIIDEFGERAIPALIVGNLSRSNMLLKAAEKMETAEEQAIFWTVYQDANTQYDVYRKLMNLYGETAVPYLVEVQLDSETAAERVTNERSKAALSERNDIGHVSPYLGEIARRQGLTKYIGFEESIAKPEGTQEDESASLEDVHVVDDSNTAKNVSENFRIEQGGN